LVWGASDECTHRRTSQRFGDDQTDPICRTLPMLAVVNGAVRAVQRASRQRVTSPWNRRCSRGLRRVCTRATQSGGHPFYVHRALARERGVPVTTDFTWDRQGVDDIALGERGANIRAAKPSRCRELVPGCKTGPGELPGPVCRCVKLRRVSVVTNPVVSHEGWWRHFRTWIRGPHIDRTSGERIIAVAECYHSAMYGHFVVLCAGAKG
jgi:hypothetical protein